MLFSESKFVTMDFKIILVLTYITVQYYVFFLIFKTMLGRQYCKY